MVSNGWQALGAGAFMVSTSTGAGVRAFGAEMLALANEAKVRLQHPAFPNP